MGRSRNQRRQMTRMYDTDYDTMSTSSTATSSDFTFIIQDMEDERQENTSSSFDAFIESLYEKRAKTREEGLKGLINALKSNVLIDFVESNYETLLHLCIGSVKKGAGSEIALASQLIGLISITSGAGDIAERVLLEASPNLLKAAKLGSESKARMAALEALALTCFIGGTNHETVEDVMAMLLRMSKHKGNNHADQTLGINKPSSEVRAAALSAWAFLLTIIPSSRVLTCHMPESLPALSTLLESEDQNVRIPAGEAIGVLFETKGISGSWYSTSQKEDDLIEQIRDLAMEAGGKGQANKKTQRSSFKGILSILEGGAVSVTSIKLKKGDTLSLDSWIHIVQYKFFSHMLGEGLQRHLQENTLLHEIFSFVPQQEKKLMSTKEKRMYMSPNSILSKARTQNMNRRRSQAHAGQVGHYGMKEDDSY